MKRTLTRLIPAVVSLLLVILLWRGLALDPRVLPSTQVGHPLPNFNLPTLQGLTLSDQTFKGHVSLINVWASWCDACTQEQVSLFNIAEATGIPVYGLNYKDDASSATRWLKTWGNPYAVVGLDPEGRLGLDLGVYGVPETFLIDESGHILHRHAGLMTAKVWERDFAPILARRQA